MTVRAKAGSLGRQRVRMAWMFLAPTLIVLTGVALWPLLRTIFYSFTDAILTLPGQYEMVGLANYADLLADRLWWTSVWNTMVFAGVSVSVETALGLSIALLLASHLRGRGVMRAIILIPWAIPVVVSGRMWQWMLHDQYGIVNHILRNLGLIERGIAWTARSDLALPVIIAVDIWITTPFMVLLILAGLTMLPKSLYEAAAVDGIPAWKQFTTITLPLLWPTITVAVLFRLLDALRMFDLAYVLSANSDDTKTVSIYAREALVNFQEMGFGSAASTAVFIMVALIVIVYVTVFRVNRRSMGA